MNLSGWDQVEDSIDSFMNQHKVVKKKPGRPRVNAVTKTITKRGPGRPKKVVKENVVKK